MENPHIDRIMSYAVTEARALDHEYLCLEHIVMVLLQDPSIVSFCYELDINASEISSDIRTFLNDRNAHDMVNETYYKDNDRPRCTASVERAFRRAYTYGAFRPEGGLPVTPIEVLKGILSEGGSPACYFCQTHGLTTEVIESRQEAKGPAASTSKVLSDYTTNLNQLAKNREIDPLIGRHTEVDDLAHILARRKKNNCVLVGQPGTGKTAIAEGLAKLIVEKKVPKALLKKVVYSLDMGKLLAGTRYRGDFEERFKHLTEALLSLDNAILFIDEIHMIFGAGSGSNSSVDVANLIKPILGHGKLLTIGATTPDEFAGSFTKDKALSRRFSRLDIEQTSVADTKKLCAG